MQHPFTLNFDDYDYTFHAKIFDLNEPPAAPLEAFELFYHNCSLNDHTIEHRFEMPCSSIYEAKTAIAVDIPIPTTLDIQTLHLYPNESRGIATYTRIQKVTR